MMPNFVRSLLISILFCQILSQIMAKKCNRLDPIPKKSIPFHKPCIGVDYPSWFKVMCPGFVTWLEFRRGDNNFQTYSVLFPKLNIHGRWYATRVRSSSRPAEAAKCFTMDISSGGFVVINGRKYGDSNNGGCFYLPQIFQLQMNTNIPTYEWFDVLSGHVKSTRFLDTDHRHFLITWTCNSSVHIGNCKNWYADIFTRTPEDLPLSLLMKVNKSLEGTLCLDVFADFMLDEFDDRACPHLSRKFTRRFLKYNKLH